MAKRRPWDLKTNILKSLRKTWFFSPLRRQIVKRCESGEFYFVKKRRKIKKKYVYVDVKTPYYTCEICEKQFEKIQIDHIEPVVKTETGFVGYDEYISRLFCDPANLQGLCKGCHASKTTTENKTRTRKKTKK